MKRIILFVYNKLTFNYNLVLNRVVEKFVKPPNVKLIDETIEYILANKCSVSRFGDGEMWIILGGEIRYQKSDKLLQNRLKEILCSNERNHIVTIPDVFTTERLKLRTEQNQEFWKNHLSIHRNDWYKYLNKDKVYYNTAISRFYIPIREKSMSRKYIELLKKIWENEEIVIIEGEKSRLGVGNDLFTNSKSIYRILCPSENAFSNYKEILDLAKAIDKNKLILIALGPTATVLSYDLCKIGYRAIDIGHIDMEYEWYKMGSEQQVKINYKYTNEVENGSEVEDIDDINYYRQIIAKVI